MIALPPPREAPYTLPTSIDLEPNLILKLLREEVPGLVAPSIDWSEVGLLTQALALSMERRGVRVRLGHPATIDAVYEGPWTDVRTLIMLAGKNLSSTARIALALVCAWQDETWRPRLNHRVWMRALADLAKAPEPEVRPNSDIREGWVRATLLTEPTMRESLQAVAGGLQLGVVRMHKTKGTPLPPREFDDETELRALILTPSATEVTVARVLALYTHLRRFSYGGLAGGLKLAEEELFRLLSSLKEVWVDDRPVTVSHEPWSSTLVVEDTADGSLQLAWSEEPVFVWRVGDSAWILDEADRVRPLAQNLRPARALLEQPLPTVPAEDVPLLLETILLHTPVPLDLRSRHLQPRPGAPEPHLVLTWEGGALHVSARFAYGGARATDHPLVVSPEGLYQRDLDTESALAAEAEAMLDGALPQVRVGEAAWDFLLEELPLFTDWAIDVDKALLPKVRKGLVAKVTFQSGLDWFDLDVDLEVDGLHVPLQRALDAWRAGNRWVTLKDGSVARLPETWLDAHGAAAEELASTGTVRDGHRRLGVAQAWAAEDLLTLADASAEVTRWQENLREIRRKIKDFSGIATHEIPPGVHADLRPYQLHGFRWLATLAELGLGGVLADDMGLGKTLQALVWLQHEVLRRPDAGPALVVAPTSVIYNWATEAARFTPELKVHVHHGTLRGAIPGDAELVITTYALLALDNIFTSRRWRAVILDEAQQIKNPVSARAQAARRLEADHRFCLTGTPLENHLGELWSLFEFAVPGFFGSLKTFTDVYVKPIQEGREARVSPDGESHEVRSRSERMTRLRTRIRPFILRRLKAEVAAELPPRTEQILTCTLGKAQRVLYESIREAYRESVMTAVAQRGVGGATIQVLEALTRMRQACCDPSLVPLPQARQVKASAKREILAELFENLVAEGRRALVFSQWPSFLALIRQDLDAAQYPYLYLDGQTRERADLQTRWNQPDGPPFFLISVKAGGTGLNLTGADVVIHLDPWWNPAVEDQATDRAHRIGQTRPVMVYKLVCRGTVEEKLVELQTRKRALFNATVNEERLLGESLTRADLESVFTQDPLEDDEAAEAPPPTGKTPSNRPTARPPDLEAAFARKGHLTLGEVATALNLSPAATRTWINTQIAAGHLHREGKTNATRYLKGPG